MTPTHPSRASTSPTAGASGQPLWLVGVDVGGTFTDVCAISLDGGAVRVAKVRNDGNAPIDFLLQALAAIDLDWREIADLVHGTTAVTNAIVEDRLADVAFVTTEGFGDTLAIGRQNRRHLYRLDLPPKDASPVQRSHIVEARERVGPKGDVIVPLDADALRQVVDGVAASGAKAVAVSLLHAYANPEHERQIGKALRAVTPYVALSHRINPETREYERGMTTVLAAGLMPFTADYVTALERLRPDKSRLHLFHSAGGMAAPVTLKDQPLGLVMSGPAAGVAAAEKLAAELGIAEAISLDMGGTTTDVCLILDHRAEVRNESRLGRWPVRVPMVAVDSIGAGGGSIARLNAGILIVGPDSAGADPGPACYGKGGTEVTVTDANVALGYIVPDWPPGRGVDAAAATRVLGPLAAAIGVDEVECACGVVRVANAAMARLLRRVTVERGIDGRRCTLIAFGGAGPMHAAELARVFGITKLVVPRLSGVFSAVGCLAAEMSYSLRRSLQLSSLAWNPGAVADVRDALSAQVTAPFAATGDDLSHVREDYVAHIRYSGQSYAVAVAANKEFDPDALGADFRARHHTLYAFAPDQPWELVALSVTARLPRERHSFAPLLARASAPEPRAFSQCWFESGGPYRTPRYHRDSIGPSDSLTGPAVIEDEWSTVVLPPGSRLRCDGLGHLHIDVEGG